MKYASDVTNHVLLIEQPYTCLTDKQVIAYLGNGVEGFAWHISDLVIYDEPKELSEFFHDCGESPNCEKCPCYYYSSTENGTEEYCCSKVEGYKQLTRPPQSWCYVEEVEE